MIELGRINLPGQYEISQEQRNLVIKKWNQYYDKHKDYYETILLKDVPKIYEIFNKHSIQLSIGMGSALGFYRENKILPWDSDLDFFSFNTIDYLKLLYDPLKLEQLINELKEINFEWVSGWVWPRIPIDKTLTEIQEYTDRYQDLDTKTAGIPDMYYNNGMNLTYYYMLYTTWLNKTNNEFDLPPGVRDWRGETLSFSYQITFFTILNPFHGFKYYFDLKKVNHLGIDFLFPLDIEEYLAAVYGENYMTPYINNEDYFRYADMIKNNKEGVKK